MLQIIQTARRTRDVFATITAKFQIARVNVCECVSIERAIVFTL